MSPILDDHSPATLVATFLDGIGEIVSIGMKLRTRPTRGVDRVAEAQFRKSYENQREELDRWLTYNLDAATAASPYDVAASLADTGQDPLMDPKTRGILVLLRKEFIEALPRAARPEVVSELGEALRVIGECGVYAPTALAGLAVALVERIEDWPNEAREIVESALQEALPTRAPSRGRPTPGDGSNGRGGAGGRGDSGKTATADPDTSASASGSISPSPRPPSSPTPTGPPSPERVLDTLFGAGAEAGRIWAECVAGMTGSPEPPSEVEILATRMAALPDQGREIACKRMRGTLPDWCAACGQGQLRALGRLAPAGETLAVVCQRVDTDPEFATAVRGALPDLARAGTGYTEAGLRAAGQVIERLWEDGIGDDFAHALANSTHSRPGTVRRLLTEGSPRLAAHLSRGGPVTEAPWRETLGRRGVPWAERLALPLGRIPADALLPLWTSEAEDDPALARGLVDAAAADAAASPLAAELLLRMLEIRPALVIEFLAPALVALGAAPATVTERPRLTRAIWDAVLARPKHLAAVPEALGDVLAPMLPESITPSRQWAAAFLRGPDWLRAPLAERLQRAQPEPAVWLEALLAEVEQGSIPGVPDDAAARVAGLLREATATA